MNKELYYLNPENRKKLLNLWFNRELCTMSNLSGKEYPVFRHCFLSNLNYWDLIAKNIKLYDIDRNVFYTSAKFSFIPVKIMGKDFFNRYVLMPNDCFNKILKENIMAYDLLLDFDFNTIEEYKDYIQKLALFLPILYKNNIKYIKSQSSIKEIGSIKLIKYHITLPYEILKLPFDFENEESNVLKHYKNLHTLIKEKFNLKFLCTGLTGVYNRVQKSPLSIYNEYILSYDVINENYGNEEFKQFYNKYLRGEI